MSTLELVAAAFGIACVWLTARQNILCWPTGLVMVILYGWIFFDANLYSDAILQVVYVVLCTYGWIHWVRGGTRTSKLPVTVLATKERLAWIGVGLGSAIGLGFVMDTRTDASLPYWDACTTTLSLVAQYLLTRKKLESWAFWIVVDVLAVGIYTVKGLYVTSGLYALFLFLAIVGFCEWNNDLKRRADSF